MESSVDCAQFSQREWSIGFGLATHLDLAQLRKAAALTVAPKCLTPTSLKPSRIRPGGLLAKVAETTSEPLCANWFALAITLWIIATVSRFIIKGCSNEL
jgi:hypothetical protein